MLSTEVRPSTVRVRFCPKALSKKAKLGGCEFKHSICSSLLSGYSTSRLGTPEMF